jgi:Cu/Ag efflux protein CusF
MNNKQILYSAAVAFVVALSSCGERQEPKVARLDSVSTTPAARPIDTISKTSAISPREFRVLATVRSVNEADSTLTIDHEAMDGFSGAMTMIYKVGDPAIFKRVRVGTYGHFTIIVTNGKGVIASVHVHHQ